MKIVVVCFVTLLFSFVEAHAATVPTGFTETLVATGLSNPTAMEFAPDGRLFVLEQAGNVRVVKNGQLLATPFLSLTVNSSGERGLLGIAFDPDFATNPYVYLYYTATAPAVHNRISRFTANGDVVVSGSEVVLMDLENLSTATNHNGGAIHFGIDGKLYIAVGENANTANAQVLTNRLGKMLRINKDGSIPTDNPFYNTASGLNRSIWTLGLRNPFTFAVQRGTGRIFINDVGAGSWEEVNDGIAGSNYGWPSAEGSTSCATYRCPLVAYPHGSGTSAGCAITGGTFYNPLSTHFPSSYTGDYFYAEHCNGWIRQYDPSAGTNTVFATGLSRAVDLKVSSDGRLFYLARGSSSNTGVVYKIEYTAGAAPIVTQHPVDQTVPAGQPATFNVSASGTTPLSYQWQKNSSDIAGATNSSYTLPSTQLSDNGALFRCIVSNSFGSDTSNQATLTVTSNNAPVAAISTPADGTFYSAGQSISYSGDGTDNEDGTLPASAFTWWVDFHHLDHTHPHVQPVSGSKSGSFSIPDSGETDSQVFYRIYLQVKDSGNLSQTVYRDVVPRISNITLASSPSGLQVTIDGQSRTTPYSFNGVVGMIRNIGTTTPQALSGTNWNFVSWSDGQAMTHNITTPQNNTTYTATFTSPGVVGDGLRGVYYNNVNFSGSSVTRVDPQINFNWKSRSPATGIDPDTFSVRWTGSVLPQYSQTYTFYTATNDGVRVWVNGQLIINRWIDNPKKESTGSISLTAGTKYSIQVEYYDNLGTASAKLSWSSASQAKQVIPQSRLFSQ